MNAHLRLWFHDEHEAARMAQSLAPENGEHLRMRRDGRVLHLEAESGTPLGLLHTLDDALACLGAAQRAARLAREP